MIRFDPEQKSFHLRNSFVSYIFHAGATGRLHHLYWGAPLETFSPGRWALDPLREDLKPVRPRISEEVHPQEYSLWGCGDRRPGACSLRLADGSAAAELLYRGHEILEQPVYPPGLPAVRQDHELGAAEAVKVLLEDPRGDLRVELYYTLYEKSPVLLRWNRIINGSEGPILLRDPASAAPDLPPDAYDLLHLSGAWGRERHVRREPLSSGSFSIGSRSGASGHQFAPFLALCSPEAGENQGCLYAATLHYSGCFSASAAPDSFGGCRLSIGIGGLEAALSPGESFDTPAASLVWTAEGFNGMSRAFHSFLREGVLPREFRFRPRPVTINSWEAMYFDMDQEKILNLAAQGAAVGAELFVLDDGWFSRRVDDRSSLGDWWANPDRFPRGLGALAEKVRERGLAFGLWVEPEMISPDSELSRKHPDWALAIPGREAVTVRNQLVLDLSRREVRDYLFDCLRRVLEESAAVYLKWDMNRTMSEAGSPPLGRERQGETMHRYMLGLYELLGRVRRAFPQVMLEGCAGGGGRMDFGMAAFCPRFWASDQTDGVERLAIQYGSSYLFPPETLGAHVSAVPNHQVGRMVPGRSRALTALAFSYGYELNPAELSPEERSLFREFSQRHKEIRRGVLQGEFFRLEGGPSEGGRREGPAGSPRETAWIIRVAAGRELLLFCFRPFCRPNLLPSYLKLSAGLPEGPALYRETRTGELYSSSELRYKGVRVDRVKGDYQAFFRRFIREDEGT